MNTIIIPKKLAQKDDLVVIPRREYESLLNSRKFKEVKLTQAQKKSLVQAEKNLRQGKTLTFNEFSRKLGFKD